MNGDEHVHYEDQRCAAPCPRAGQRGWNQVIPREWPNDAAALADRIAAMRHQLTVLRGEVDDIARDSHDMDSRRLLADVRGCIQGAIVQSYSELERYRRSAERRTELERAASAAIPESAPGPLLPVPENPTKETEQ